MLLKLKTQEVKFLVLDEPFKGVDAKTQETMVELLKKNLPTDCTVLFSNHEGNHGLDTHILRISQEDKHFQILESCGKQEK